MRHPAVLQSDAPATVPSFMRRRLPIAALLLACLAVVEPAVTSGAAPRVPRGFFGVAPQTTLTAADAAYMRAGGIESVRWPMVWSAIQPTAKGGYDWSSFDQTVAVAARAGLQVLPSIGTTPRWLASKPTTLPIDNARQRAAWTSFLQAAVTRYGPGGEFWREHAHEGIDYEPAIARPMPIRAWQVWNEPNFFYFAYPVSPVRYAKLVTLSSQAIKGVSPSAKVILSGLFGEPTAKGARGMPAATFLKRLYRTPGIKNSFDGVALHPYAVDTETLEELVEAFHEVTVENHDRVPLYITEMGWGSQSDFNKVAFEQGPQGQVKELRGAYGYLLANQRRLDLEQVYWFSWKDIPNACNFCDSVGFFPEGPRFKPKPAWHAFVALTGGRARP
jgi:Beta-galactosidase